nr:wiskott-Aldrich syndrome protein homolog 1-like [Aegilops tauschii subsp. strangulata]
MAFLCHAPCVAGALRLPCRVAAPPSSALVPRALLCCSASCYPQLLRPRRRFGAGAPASPPAAPPSASCTHLRPWASRPRRCAAALTCTRPVPGRQDDCTACSPGPHPPARRRPRAAPFGSASPLALAGFCRTWRPRTRGSACALAPVLRAGFRHPTSRFRPRRLPPSGLPASHAACASPLQPAPTRAAPAVAPPRQSTRADHRLRIRLRRLPPHRADSVRGRLLAAAVGPGRVLAAASRRLASTFAAPRLRDPAPASVRLWPPAPRASSIAAPRPPASPADWCHARPGRLPRWPTPRPPGRPGCLPTTCSRATFRCSATAAGRSCWKGTAAQEKKET